MRDKQSIPGSLVDGRVDAVDRRSPRPPVVFTSDELLSRTSIARRTLPCTTLPGPRTHSGQPRPRANSLGITIFSCTICFCIMLSVVYSFAGIKMSSMRKSHAHHHGDMHMSSSRPRETNSGKGGTLSKPYGASTEPVSQTLVLYTFSNTDAQYYGNLLYFVNYGMPGCDTCEYIVVVNDLRDNMVLTPFPPPLVGISIIAVRVCCSWL